MKVLYPIYGIAIVALYVVLASRGVEPLGVSSARKQAKPVTAGMGRTTGRRHSTFIWLGGYGGK